MIILIATRNKGKKKEFAEMLGESIFEWRDLDQYPNAVEVEETGLTFRANACLKASEYARQTGHWTIADDSGLEVDALDRAPGVYSARWAEKHSAGKGDQANNQLLLQQIADIPDEKLTARFVCVLALSDPDGRIVLTARDSVEGRMIRQPRGTNGFGYDPLFLFPQLGKTTAELSPEEKHAISHRGKALVQLKSMMAKLGSVFSTPAIAESII